MMSQRMSRSAGFNSPIHLAISSRSLADGAAPSKDCRRLVDPSLPENLRYARSGQHYVVFIAGPDRMIVVDFLHVRMDLPARLAALGEGDISS